MSSLIPILTIVGIVLGVIAIIAIAIKCCWKIAGTNEVLIVSGLGKVKTKTGGGLFVIPVIQKTQRMTLENIQVDFTSRSEIPTKDAINILVDAVANMSISQDPERQKVAASKFAGYSIEQREGCEEVKHLASLLRKITDGRRKASCEMKDE